MEVERLRGDLERAAAGPRADLDFTAAARRGHAIRRRRTAALFAGAGLLVVAVVAVPLFLLSSLRDAPGDGRPPVGTGKISEPVVPLAKAEGWRPTADPPLPFGLVEIAYEQETAERAWDENVPADLVEREGEPAEPGLYGNPDDVDFDTHALIVWSSGQSGICPGWLEDVTTSEEQIVTVRTGVHAPGNACTDDYNPYRMVLAVSRDRLPAAEDLPAEADIDYGISGVAVAYPYSEGTIDETEDEAGNDSSSNALVPPSELRGDKVAMPVTFPDGTMTTVTADRSLGIQRMRAQPYSSGGIGGIDRTIEFFYGSSRHYAADGPLETFEGHDGTPVEVWSPRPVSGEEHCPNLIYRFGRWGVAVRTCQDELTEEEKRIWARGLVGRVTDDGYLVLEAEGGLTLDRGPSIVLSREGTGVYIRLDTGRCIRPSDGDQREMPDGTKVTFNQGKGVGFAATWCLDDYLGALAIGSREFAESAAASLRAEK